MSSIEYYNLTFFKLQKSLETLGLNAEEIQSIFKIIAIVIKLGNLIFVPMTNIDGTEGCQVSNEYGSKNYYWNKFSFSLNCFIELMEIAQLLQIDPQILVSCLTRAESNWIQMDNGPELNAASATHTTLSLCRTLYGRLFTWIVGRINDSLKVYSFFLFSTDILKMYHYHYHQSKHSLRGKNLGILDFYGFENIERNSFEQLAINYCDERLHQVSSVIIFAYMLWVLNLCIFSALHSNHFEVPTRDVCS